MMSLKQLRHILGLIATLYYSKFIKNYAKIDKPFYFSSHKNILFYWTADCQQAYDLITVSLDY